MVFYLARRLAILVATLAFASLIVFAALEVLPGNAAETMLGASATPEAVAELARKLGLDQPWPARYFAWTSGALRGDLGQSYAYSSPIASLIGERLEVTLPLTVLAMIIAAAVALTAGLYAAERRGKSGDALVMSLSQLGLAIPNFWFGILLVLLFAVHWRLFPAGGFPGWSDPAKALKALILPAMALGLVQAAILTRVTRSALLEALAEDFMRTARAKGLSRARRFVASCPAQRGAADPHHRRFAILIVDRRRGGGGERVCVAGTRPAHRTGDRQPRRPGGRGLRDGARWPASFSSTPGLTSSPPPSIRGCGRR